MSALTPNHLHLQALVHARTAPCEALAHPRARSEEGPREGLVHDRRAAAFDPVGRERPSFKDRKANGLEERGRDSVEVGWPGLARRHRQIPHPDHL